MQDEEDKHNKEVISHLQKVQHHEYEHEQAIEDIKEKGSKFMHDEDEKHNEIENLNRKTKAEAKEEYERNDKGHIGEVNQKEADLRQNISVLEDELENNKVLLIQNYEQKLKDLEEEFAEATEDNAKKLGKKHDESMKAAMAADTLADSLQAMIGIAAFMS